MSKSLTVAFLLVSTWAYAERAQLGSVTLEPPAGWIRTEDSNGVAFAPPDAAEDVYWIVSPTLETANAEAGFQAIWTAMQSTATKVEAQEPRLTRAKAGHELRSVTGSWVIGEEGASFYVLLSVAHSDSRSQPMLLLASSRALFDQHVAAVRKSVDSLRFLPPGKQLSSAPAARRSTPSGLIGRWTDGHASLAGFENTLTGQRISASGSGVSYEFLPNGTYTHARLIESSMYNCTLKVFIYQAGTYETRGDTLTLRMKDSRYEVNDNCSPSRNKNERRPLEVQKLRWEVGYDQDSQLALALLEPDDEQPEVLRRAQ